MPGGPRRPTFYLAVLATGFVLGGVLAGLLRLALPDSPAKTIFTSAWRPELGPATMNLLVVHLTVGPVGVDVTLLSLVGVVIAYFVAKSLF
jgi:Domain of unknown function (DUF4321)